MTTGLVQDHVVRVLSEVLAQATQDGTFDLSPVPQPSVGLPKREEWGDLSSNIAMTVAPLVRQPPLKVANLLARYLQELEGDLFERVDVAPPGFLNLTIKPKWWLGVLEQIEAQGKNFGTSQEHKGQRVLLEFVSANPTGPLHVGHGRGAALGQALANLLEASGYSVEREFYLNDAGRQLRLLGESVFARYQEMFGRSVPFPEDGYQGAYIKPVAQHLGDCYGKALLDKPVEEAKYQCSQFAYKELLNEIKQDLKAFGVEFDHWYSETSLTSSGLLEKTLAQLQQKGFLVEKDGALWFRSSQFKDEKDRVITKQNGDRTYLASDIAYHREKLERGFDVLVNIWGADHNGYIPRMHAAIQALGYPKESLRVVLVQMVNLLRAGEKVEMSKRAGEFVTLREVIEEVGSDAAKFFFLMRRSDTHLDFDLDLAKQQSNDNPVYYVQYAYARLASLFRVARDRGVSVSSIQDIKTFHVLGKDELRLMKQLSYYPSCVAKSANALEPYRLTFYLQELAGLLHTYYYKHRVLPPVGAHQQKEEGGSALPPPFPELPKNGNDRSGEERVTSDMTAARLVLLRHVQTVLRNGLTLLGLSALEQM